MLVDALEKLRRDLPRLCLGVSVAAVVLGGVLSRPVSADGAPRLQVRAIDVTGYPQVTFVASVQDQNGLSLPGLTAQSFAATAGNRQLAVASARSIEEGEAGIAAILVIDTSGSMAGQPIQAAREAATMFVSRLRPVDEAAVIGFADAVATLTDFTNDPAGARAALDGLNAKGNTALYQAVVDAAAAAKARSKTRRAVLLLSDGQDFGAVSAASRQQSLEAARSAGVPFYVIGLGPSTDRQYLQELADATAGRLFVAPTASQLQRTFAEIADLVNTEYVVTLDLTNAGLQGDTRVRLTVNVGGQTTSTDFILALPLVIPEETRASAEGRTSITVPAWAIPAIAAVITLVALAALAVVVKRLLGGRRHAPLPGAFLFDPATYAVAGPVESGAGEPALAKLVLDSGAEVPLGHSVVTLGTDPDCTLRLPVAAADFGHGSISFWLANGRFLLNDDSRRPRVRVNGVPKRWAFLDFGDEVEVAGVRMRLALGGNPDEAASKASKLR